MSWGCTFIKGLAEFFHRESQDVKNHFMDPRKRGQRLHTYFSSILESCFAKFKKCNECHKTCNVHAVFVKPRKTQKRHRSFLEKCKIFSFTEDCNCVLVGSCRGCLNRTHYNRRYVFIKMHEYNQHPES